MKKNNYRQIYLFGTWCINVIIYTKKKTFKKKPQNIILLYRLLLCIYLQDCKLSSFWIRWKENVHDLVLKIYIHVFKIYGTCICTYVYIIQLKKKLQLIFDKLKCRKLKHYLFTNKHFDCSTVMLFKNE